VSYGFDAPTGRYHGGDPTNVGLGFFEQQLQAALRYHFDSADTLSGFFVPTLGIPQKKIDEDLTPGTQLSFNWGLRKNFADGRGRLALLGHDTWQVSNDHGSDADLVRSKDQVHAAGVQLGIPKYGLSSFAMPSIVRDTGRPPC